MCDHANMAHLESSLSIHTIWLPLFSCIVAHRHHLLPVIMHRDGEESHIVQHSICVLKELFIHRREYKEEEGKNIRFLKLKTRLQTHKTKEPFIFAMLPEEKNAKINLWFATFSTC